MSCVFCKIANGEIPSISVYEDESFKVIMDINPANLGHCLVICKEHYANIFEMPSELTAKAFAVAKKVAGAVKEATDCDGINILQNNGEIAGQTVFHFHIHILPRVEGDLVNIHFGGFNAEEDMIKQIAEDIKNKL